MSAMMMRGTAIGSVAELKRHFSIAELIQLYDSGELVIWLRHIGEAELAEKAAALPADGYLLTALYQLLHLPAELTEEDVRRSG